MIRAKALLAAGDRSACEHDVETVLGLLPELGASREGIRALMDFSVDLGPQRMRELIEASPAAHLLLPLKTALERELGLEPQVAREVEEVAQDIQGKLATLKANRVRPVWDTVFPQRLVRRRTDRPTDPRTHTMPITSPRP